MQLQKQIDDKFIISGCGKYAVQLDENKSHFEWLFKRECADCPFYSLRKATEKEIHIAKRHLEFISFAITLPTNNNAGVLRGEYE
jgi:hypothetical protein